MDRGGGNAESVGRITINFHEDSYVRLSDDVDKATTTDESALLLGKDGELYVFGGGMLADRSLLANYFGGDDFFDVIGVDDLSFDIL